MKVFTSSNTQDDIEAYKEALCRRGFALRALI